MARKSSSVLKVDSPSKIPDLEKLIKQGKVTFVLVYADWCGHCTKFKKDIWEPMCKKEALHNRAAVRDDMIPKTSLANTKYKYLPSVLVINEQGRPEEFETPEGVSTNAMPTPKSLEDMNRVVNVSLKPLPTLTPQEPIESPEANDEAIYTSTRSNSLPIPKTYVPEEKEIQKGGRLLQTLKRLSKHFLKKSRRTSKRNQQKRKRTVKRKN